MWVQLSSLDLELRIHLMRFGANWSDSNRTHQIGVIRDVNQTEWTQFSVTLGPMLLINTYEVQLILEGKLGANSKGAIAIDDIRLVENACPSMDLVCEDGTPLKPEQVCVFNCCCY